MTGLPVQRVLFIKFFLGIFGVWKGLPLLPRLISSTRALPFPQQKVCSWPRGQAEGAAGVAKYSLRLTSNLNLDVVRSSVRGRVSFHLGQSGQWGTGP